MKRLGLTARLAAALAGLVALTAIAISAAAFVSTSGQVNSDVDRFLRERADQITSGDRDQPDNRRGDSSNNRNRGGDPEPTPVEQLARAVDDDAIVQVVNSDGEIVASTGIALPINDETLSLADKSGPSTLQTVEIDGVDHRILTQHAPEVGALQIAVNLSDTSNLLDSIKGRFLLIGLAPPQAPECVGPAGV